MRLRIVSTGKIGSLRAADLFQTTRSSREYLYLVIASKNRDLVLISHIFYTSDFCFCFREILLRPYIRGSPLRMRFFLLGMGLCTESSALQLEFYSWLLVYFPFDFGRILSRPYMREFQLRIRLYYLVCNTFKLPLTLANSGLFKENYSYEMTFRVRAALFQHSYSRVDSKVAKDCSGELRRLYLCESTPSILVMAKATAELFTRGRDADTFGRCCEVRRDARMASKGRFPPNFV